MASQIHMPGPICLIENTNGKLVINPEALKILSAITDPLVVVAIVGLYRTGKSYLMNKLAGKKKGEWHQQSFAESLVSTHPPNFEYGFAEKKLEMENNIVS